jgi:hypothetical protein
MSAVMKDAVDKREEGLGTDYHLEPRFSKEEGTSVRTADDIVLELETVFKPLSL